MENAYLLLLNGLRSARELSISSSIRLDKLLEVWDHTSCIILSTGFTRYKRPFLDEHGYPATESRVAARVLLRRGVERSKILVEEASSDTIGNIYFSMSLFVQPLNIKTVRIVTSRFHIPRAQAISDWICSLSGWRTVPSIFIESAPDPEMPSDLRALVTAKETAGIHRIADLSRTVLTVPQLCLWLQNHHNAYRFDGQMDCLPTQLLQLY